MYLIQMFNIGLKFLIISRVRAKDIKRNNLNLQQQQQYSCTLFYGECCISAHILEQENISCFWTYNFWCPPAQSMSCPLQAYESSSCGHTENGTRSLSKKIQCSAAIRSFMINWLMPITQGGGIEYFEY